MTQTEQVRDVVDAAQAVGGSPRALEREDIARRWVGLCAAFGVDGNGDSTWLWNAVDDRASRHAPDATTAARQIAPMIGARRCLVFFEDFFGAVSPVAGFGFRRPGHERLSCVEVVGGEAAAVAVGETYGEVCVADPAYAWALMLNHHDHLVGIGEGKAWVESELPHIHEDV